MSDLVLLALAQMRRIEPFFSRSLGLVRVDDRRVISGINDVIRNGLQWKDAPPGDGPHKTLYNRFVRWSRLGVFARIFAALAGEGGVPERLMIDSHPPQGSPHGRQPDAKGGPRGATHEISA